jgi:FlaA1/EpsC-like NDP-sugar epimerase
MTRRQRRALVVASHLVAIAVANYLAFQLRFDGAVPPPDAALFRQFVIWVIAIRGVGFALLRLYEGLWRYTSVYDLRRILIGVGASTVALYVLVYGVYGAGSYPRSVFIVDSLLLTFFMGGGRLVYRTLQELRRLQPQKRLLIYGAGDAGELIVRDLRRYHTYEPIGFVDDDPQKIGRRIHGVSVLGSREQLSQIVVRERPHEVLIAMPGADPVTVRSIVKILEPFKIPIRTLPNLRDLDRCRVTVTDIRALSIEDLLTRAPVGLDSERVREIVTGKRVLVTGAGGSIGGELCRQIAALEPELLVLYERYENSLYQIANGLEGHKPIIRSVIGDITDRRRLDAVFAQYRPQLVFHAAAHKHVPLMELNVCEAVKNNVSGTRRLSEAALRHGVEKVVLISSDKAVNPSSVMGATKRVAELILLERSSRSTATQFVTVRFGNVLGSNGSVVPRFLEQIRTGGPVTVTHPEMRRFFMLIPEAVQLVLHAAAVGEGGAVYVLDMGEQIKLLDVARNLIRLSGLVPDEEIAISYTGPRPGEKLYEELVGTGEALEPSAVDKILRVRTQGPTVSPALASQLRHLERLAIRGDSDGVLMQLACIVPTFREPANETAVGATEAVAVSAGPADPALRRARHLLAPAAGRSYAPLRAATAGE